MAIKDANEKFKYPTCSKLVNSVRSLPNSNADAERVFSMLTNRKTKKRNSLSAIHVQALCVVKSCLRARAETARTMRVDARHLALMSFENLYKSRVIHDTSFLHLFADDDEEFPCTSSDL